MKRSLTYFETIKNKFKGGVLKRRAIHFAVLLIVFLLNRKNLN